MKKLRGIMSLGAGALVLVSGMIVYNAPPPPSLSPQVREFWTDGAVHTDAHVFANVLHPEKVHVVPYGVVGWQNYPDPVTTQIKHPGDVELIASASTVVLCGCKAAPTGGYIGVVTVLKLGSQGAYQQIGADYTAAGSIFCGVVFSPSTSTIYLLDAAKKRIVKAAYGAGSAPPTSYTTVLDDSQFAPLADISKYTLAMYADGSEPTLAIARYWSRKHNAAEDIIGDLYTVNFKAAGPVTATFQAEGIELLGGMLTKHLIADGTTSIEAMGPEGATINIVRVDNSSEVVGSNQIVGGVTNVATTPLVMGGIYVAEVIGFPKKSPPYLAAMRICGANDALPNGSGFAEWDGGIGLDSHIGNADFGVGLQVNVDPAHVVLGTTYTAAILVGSAADITTVNGKKILSGNILYTDLRLPEAKFPGVIVLNVPIPLDQNLANIEFYAQCVVDVGGGDLRYSKIGGVLLRAVPFIPPGMEDMFPEDVALGGGSSSARSQGSAASLRALGTARARPWTEQTAVSWMKWMKKLGAASVRGKQLETMFKDRTR